MRNQPFAPGANPLMASATLGRKGQFSSPTLHIVRRLALPVAVAHGFRATRLIHEPKIGRGALPQIFEWLSRAAIPVLERNAIAFADHTFGLRDTGRMTTEIAARIFRALPEGVS